MKSRLSSLNIQLRIALKSMDYREVLKREMEISSFFDRRYPRRRQKHYKFPNLNLVRTLVIMYACSAIHLGPMPRFVFKFIRIGVNCENIENDMKTIEWMENI